MGDYIHKNKKMIIVIGAAIFLLIIGISVYNLVWNNIYSAKINVRLAPSIAKVVIDEKEYAIGEHRIKPGEYVAEIKAEGFVSKTGNLVAVAGETTEIILFLEPTEDNLDWYAEHSVEATALGDIKNDLAQMAMEKFVASNPLLQTLPIEVDYYTSGYGERVKYTVFYKLNEDFDDYSFVITDYTGGNYENALERLRARGIEIGERKIEYFNKTEEYEWGYAK